MKLYDDGSSKLKLSVAVGDVIESTTDWPEGVPIRQGTKAVVFASYEGDCLIFPVNELLLENNFREDLYPYWTVQPSMSYWKKYL